MKAAQARELLDKIDKEIIDLQEKRRAKRLEFERGFASGKTSGSVGDPNADFRQIDGVITKLKGRRGQLIFSLEQAGVQLEVEPYEEEPSLEAEEPTGGETPKGKKVKE